jgi:hypothetical protein
MEKQQYDVIVVGGGHAGSEASLAAARMGMKTLLVTLNLDIIGFMPCNPSIGGPAKGVVVREIDALGGEMGRNIDKTYIQMRMLNTGKGPAVRALRAQADKYEYQNELKKTLENTENLDLRQGIVEKLIVEDNVVKGVQISTGTQFFSKAVIITAGTALRGEIIIGELKYSSGPNNSLPAIGLADHLKELGLEIERFKTGTPPRVKSSSINYDVTEIQPGDTTPNHFSFETLDESYKQEQLPCWLTYTNLDTHGVIRENLHRAPMFTGIVEGVGARYCPSIEDKVVKFADKDRHQIFLEPESKEMNTIYVQGFSTSMPHDIQEKILAGFTFGSKEKKESTPEMDEFLEKAGITLLRDEYVLIDDSFYLYGRPDYERPGRGIDKRKTPQEITEGMDVSLPVLVIDHEPRELQELADTGVDVDLCGHTHDGQVFPGNIVIRFFWENPCGYLKKGNMHNIVTSGVGLFGPNMRVGTKSEICDVSICFN